MANTVKLSELSLRELLEYERAAHLICAKYENLNKMESYLSEELNEEFRREKAKYDAIMQEIENRVDQIK